MLVWCTRRQQFHVAPAMQQPNRGVSAPLRWIWSRTSYCVTSYLCHVVHCWHLQPQNERCQLIKAHMSLGEITGVSSGWLSVCMLLGDVGDTDIYKQHDAAMMEMRACIHNLTWQGDSA